MASCHADGYLLFVYVCLDWRGDQACGVETAIFFPFFIWWFLVVYMWCVVGKRRWQLCTVLYGGWVRRRASKNEKSCDGVNNTLLIECQNVFVFLVWESWIDKISARKEILTRRIEEAWLVLAKSARREFPMRRMGNRTSNRVCTSRGGLNYGL